MTPIDNVRRFASNNLLLDASIRSIEEETGFFLLDRTTESEAIDETYYPQFDEKYREEAAAMAANV